MYRQNTQPQSQPSVAGENNNTGNIPPIANTNTSVNFEEQMSLRGLSNIIQGVGGQAPTYEPSKEELHNVLLTCVDVIRVSRDLQKKLKECETSVKRSTKSIRYISTETQKN